MFAAPQTMRHFRRGMVSGFKTPPSAFGAKASHGSSKIERSPGGTCRIVTCAPANRDASARHCSRVDVRGHHAPYVALEELGDHRRADVSGTLHGDPLARQRARTQMIERGFHRADDALRCRR